MKKKAKKKSAKKTKHAKNEIRALVEAGFDAGFTAILEATQLAERHDIDSMEIIIKLMMRKLLPLIMVRFGSEPSKRTKRSRDDQNLN